MLKLVSFFRKVFWIEKKKKDIIFGNKVLTNRVEYIEYKFSDSKYFDIEKIKDKYKNDVNIKTKDKKVKFYFEWFTDNLKEVAYIGWDKGKSVSWMFDNNDDEVEFNEENVLNIDEKMNVIIYDWCILKKEYLWGILYNKIIFDNNLEVVNWNSPNNFLTIFFYKIFRKDFLKRKLKKKYNDIELKNYVRPISFVVHILLLIFCIELFFVSIVFHIICFFIINRLIVKEQKLLEIITLKIDPIIPQKN